VILGGGAADVVVQVPSTSIASMHTGLAATVRADGATAGVSGVVTQIGLLPTTTSSTPTGPGGATATSTTTTYPVTVRVAAGAGLVDGSSASVGIAIKSVKNVVTVPNSALHGTTVEVLSKGKVSTVRVQTGAVGALVTQVTSGLTAGQSVVLADLSVPLPTSSTTTTTNRGGFGPGGFPGGAGGGGGFGGGAGGGAGGATRGG
jgi:HlyD family secretion protein